MATVLARCPWSDASPLAAVATHVVFPPAHRRLAAGREVGGVDCAVEFEPQHRTVPELDNAHVWAVPVAISTVTPRPLGTVAWPERLSPQQWTPPVRSSAHTWALPSLTWSTGGRSGGTSSAPRPLAPQQTTTPKLSTVHVAVPDVSMPTRPEQGVDGSLSRSRQAQY